MKTVTVQEILNEVSFDIIKHVKSNDIGIKFPREIATKYYNIFHEIIQVNKIKKFLKYGIMSYDMLTGKCHIVNFDNEENIFSLHYSDNSDVSYLTHMIRPLVQFKNLIACDGDIDDIKYFKKKIYKLAKLAKDDNEEDCVRQLIKYNNFINRISNKITTFIFNIMLEK